MISEEKLMRMDLAGLDKARCAPQRTLALEGDPMPVKVDVIDCGLC